MADRRAYIEGNNVRKIQGTAVPGRRYDEHVRPVTKKKQKHEVISVFDLKYTLVMVVAVLFAMAACTSFLNVQAQLASQNREIATLQSEYQALVNDNDAANARINGEIDLDAIKKTAMEELGMVYPQAGQIVTYESAKEQYVKQYQDVPDVK